MELVLKFSEFKIIQNMMVYVKILIAILINLIYMPLLNMKEKHTLNYYSDPILPQKLLMLKEIISLSTFL